MRTIEGEATATWAGMKPNWRTLGQPLLRDKRAVAGLAEATGRLMQGGAAGITMAAAPAVACSWGGPAGLHSMSQDQSTAVGQSGWGR